MDKIFVIVVTYNGREWYDRCFQSLLNSTIQVQIIVYDNASTDGSAKYIRDVFPETILMESKENLGFGKGNNVALRYALEHSCDYVFLLNQDAWVEPDTIEKLVAIHKNHPEFGIISPMHLNTSRDGLVMKHFCQQPDNEKLITDLYFNQLVDIYETTYIHAAAWLLPRKTLETVGGFDPIYKHYEEDDDYLNRVRFHKLKIGICPSAQIIHDHRAKSESHFNTKSRYHHEQELLVKLTNLNSSMKIREYVLFCFRKMIKSVLTWNSTSLRDYWADFLFVLENRKTIDKSKKCNSKVGTTWLTI